MYSGIVGSCYCDSNCTNCVNAVGANCTPETGNTCVQLLSSVKIASTSYAHAESDCFCPTADCTIDATLDGISDCYDSKGYTCNPTDVINNSTGASVADGRADNCITQVQSPDSL